MSDLRFERTEDMLQLYFIKLLKKMPFEQISISKLAKHSKINRTTFYAHYDNTYQLASSMIDYHITHIEKILNESASPSSKGKDITNSDHFNSEIFNYLMDYRTEIQLLRQLNFGINSFDSKLKNIFLTSYSKILQLRSNTFSHYLLTTIAFSNFDFIIQNKKIPSKSEIKEGLTRVITYLE